MKINIKKIDKILKDKGWSYSDYARAMKVERQWVYDVMAGKAGKTFETADRFAKALGLTGKDIVED